MRSLFNKGFTLIEILVVLTIIGVTLGFTVLAFGDFGAERRILVTADQLLNAFKLTQQQAILESSTLGMLINQNGYQAYRFTPPATWNVISNKNVFRFTPFPKGTKVNLKTNAISKLNMPNIIFNASGDITPFNLQLGTAAEPYIISLNAQQNGNLSLKKNNNE